jgi:hypothetical protein
MHCALDERPTKKIQAPDDRLALPFYLIKSSRVACPLLILISKVSEVKGHVIWLDRIALRFPGRQSTFEEFDPYETHGTNSMQNCSAGFITGAGAVNN